MAELGTRTQTYLVPEPDFLETENKQTNKEKQATIKHGM